MRVHHPIFDGIIERCRDLDPIAVAVVSPLSEVAIRGAIDAARAGLINPYLIGPQAKIAAVARKHGVEIAPYLIVDVADDIGLRSKRRMSHAFVVEAPSYPRTLIITDAAVNVNPKLEEKADIVQNAIDLAHVLGIAVPKVAILSTVETVSSNIPSTIDAAALCKMADRGQIMGGVLDGPLAFDDATEPEAARIKQIDSPLAGQADILVAPDAESGNMLVKQFQSLAGVEAAGVVLGARVPIILTSRAANPKIRLASTAIAALLAQKDRQELSAVTSGIGVLLQSKAWLSSNGSESQ